jgi:hypothetical protein
MPTELNENFVKIIFSTTQDIGLGNMIIDGNSVTITYYPDISEKILTESIKDALSGINFTYNPMPPHMGRKFTLTFETDEDFRKFGALVDKANKQALNKIQNVPENPELSIIKTVKGIYVEEVIQSLKNNGYEEQDIKNIPHFHLNKDKTKDIADIFNSFWEQNYDVNKLKIGEFGDVTPTATPTKLEAAKRVFGAR